MPQDVSINEIIDGMELCRYWVGYFEDLTDKFCVFGDVADIFHKIELHGALRYGQTVTMKNRQRK